MTFRLRDQAAWLNLPMQQKDNSFIPSSSLILERPAFLKQFLKVFGVTSAHANTSIYKTSMIEIFWSSFLPSVVSIIFRITFVLYFAFKEQALHGS